MNFNREQIKQILVGTEQGLNTKYYANPEYSSLQMGEIRLGLLTKVNVDLYANKDFNHYQMKVIKRQLIERNPNVSVFAKPEYSAGQMEEIALALKHNVDIFKYVSLGFCSVQL